MLNAAEHQSVEHIFSPTSIFSHDLLNPDDLPFNMQTCGSSLGNPQPRESSALYLRIGRHHVCLWACQNCRDLCKRLEMFAVCKHQAGIRGQEGQTAKT